MTISSGRFLAQQAAADELYDIVTLAPKAPIWPLLIWSLVLIAFLALVTLLVLKFFSGRKPEVLPQPPHEKARARFRLIQQRAEDVSANELMLEVSDALKDYLSENYNDPLRFETAQEFLSRISQEETKLPNAAQQELRGFLVAAEELKFGNIPEAERKSLPLVKAAENVVNLCETISR